MLNIPQKGVLSVENFYKTDEDAEAAIATVYVDTYKNFSLIPEVTGYNYGPYFMFTNFQADDIVPSGSGADDCVPEREFHDFRYTTDNCVILGGYTAIYRSIHKCNLVINNFEKEDVVKTPVIKRAIAEARVMRAFDHMLLGIYWGTAPIVTEVLTGSARPTNSESQDQILKWVADECTAALPDLIERQSPTDRDGVNRITKGFANAVKGKALLFAKDYNGAKAALKAVIDSKKYELHPDISEILHVPGDCSSESIFEFNCYVDGSVVNVGDMFQRSASCNFANTFDIRWEYLQSPNIDDRRIEKNGWGWINPTGDFARDLIANDGIDSPRRKAWFKTYDEILYDLKYLTDGDNFVPGKTAAKAADKTRGINGTYYGSEGFFHWKRVVHPEVGDQGDNGWSVWNTNIMRYAEVLLMYAECQAVLGDDGTGLAALNAIQERAGSKHRSTKCTLEEVKSEKRFEMWLEGCRSADLIRWGDLATLKTADYYVPVYKDKLFDGSSSVHEGYVDESNSDFWKKKYGDKLGFHTGKDEFFPFPKREMDLNPELKQNKGWE